MHSLTLLEDLFKHMNWADAKVWDCVLSLQNAQKDDKIKRILHHYQLTKYAFYYIWSGLPLEFPELSKFKTLHDLAVWASGYPDLLQAYFAGLKEEDLNKMIKIPWADRLEKLLGKKPLDANLAETMLQVAAHSSHHRGQVNNRIHELKNEPPLIDFIAWVWLGKPSAVWLVPV
jgi:uncharacterized damage-inducible protein DinB